MKIRITEGKTDIKYLLKQTDKEASRSIKSLEKEQFRGEPLVYALRGLSRMDEFRKSHDQSGTLFLPYIAQLKNSTLEFFHQDIGATFDRLFENREQGAETDMYFRWWLQST